MNKEEIEILLKAERSKAIKECIKILDNVFDDNRFRSSKRDKKEFDILSVNYNIVEQEIKDSFKKLL